MAKDGTKKSIFKKWWFWVIVVLVVGGIGASTGGSSDEQSAKKVESDKQENTDSAKKDADDEKDTDKKDDSKDEDSKDTDKKETFKVGDEIQLGDNILVVNSVKKSQGTQFSNLKSGYEYVIVNVTIKNGGDDNINYNPTDFQMANSDGNLTMYSPLSMIDGVEDLELGELLPDGKVSGDLVFEEPKDDKGLVLNYSVSWLSDDTIKVKIK